MIKDRHIGRFSISRRLINDYPSAVLDFMRGMIVIEASLDACSDCFRYTAINASLFRGVPIGEIAPEYMLEYDSNNSVVDAQELEAK